MPTPLPQFPDGFRWGTATASYQIEGAVHADGRGASVWDTFCAEPGRIRDGHTGEVACDHYHRFAEDIALMDGLGLDAYRFSISWSRVLPEGTGRVNKPGLDFYDRLVDGLLARGITPVPTLFHWDLPQSLEDDGGWLNRDTAQHFADYAQIVTARLGDRVKEWITLNEPVVHSAFGYMFGTHAPGRTLLLDGLPAAHHQLLGHGRAAQAIRATGGKVALANNLTPVSPAGEGDSDEAAAAAYDAFHNRFFMDPLLRGEYPDLSAFGVTDMPYVHHGDLELISAPLDWLGVNFYNPTRIAAPSPDGLLPFDFAPIEGVPRTAFDWPVVPAGLTQLLAGLKSRYGTALPPVQITENGASYPEKYEDQGRIDYLDGHIRAVHDALAAGVDVRGYFVWSLLDNFEWAEGYHQRFGLVHVDFETLERTPKKSYAWLRDQLRSFK